MEEHLPGDHTSSLDHLEYALGGMRPARAHGHKTSDIETKKAPEPLGLDYDIGPLTRSREVIGACSLRRRLCLWGHSL